MAEATAARHGGRFLGSTGRGLTRMTLDICDNLTHARQFVRNRRRSRRVTGRSTNGPVTEERDIAAFQSPLPAPYDACEKVPTSVSSLLLVRYRLVS